MSIHRAVLVFGFLWSNSVFAHDVAVVVQATTMTVDPYLADHFQEGEPATLEFSFSTHSSWTFCMNGVRCDFENGPTDVSLTFGDRAYVALSAEISILNDAPADEFIIPYESIDAPPIDGLDPPTLYFSVYDLAADLWDTHQRLPDYLPTLDQLNNGAYSLFITYEDPTVSTSRRVSFAIHDVASTMSPEELAEPSMVLKLLPILCRQGGVICKDARTED